jgi:outer membrane protein OmpA-like peptidoglycan-associated protein
MALTTALAYGAHARACTSCTATEGYSGECHYDPNIDRCDRTRRSVAVLLTGCATTSPEGESALDHARAAVQRLEDQPLASQTAGKALQDARERDAAVAHQQALLAQQSAQQAQQQALASQQQARDAQKQLEDMRAKQTDRGMMLTLGNVLFDTGGDTLRPGADELVSRLSQFLQNHPDIKVRIEGHTDSIGSDSYNEALSQRRAEAVATALETRGVPATRIEAVGRGKSAPVAGNDTSAGRQQNRRVEIIFSDAQGQFISG